MKTINNILGFESKFPDTTVIKLEQNYRSTKNILAVANEVIHNNNNRKDKKFSVYYDMIWKELDIHV